MWMWINVSMWKECTFIDSTLFQIRGEKQRFTRVCSFMALADTEFFSAEEPGAAPGMTRLQDGPQQKDTERFS